MNLEGKDKNVCWMVLLKEEVNWKWTFLVAKAGTAVKMLFAWLSGLDLRGVSLEIGMEYQRWNNTFEYHNY